MKNLYFLFVALLLSVTARATVGVITGDFNICYGSTSVLSSATTGGTWSSGAASIAAIDASGMVTGVSPGTATISYTTSAGTDIAVVTVNPATPPVVGITSICISGTTSLSCAVTGGTWSSANPAVGSINPSTGAVIGVSAGTVVISYVPAGGCPATTIVTVSIPPPLVVGSSSICVGGAMVLEGVPAGGTWTSAVPSVAAISSGGVVTGINPGTTNITYSVSGCTSLANITVNATPGPIGGVLQVCEGASTNLFAIGGSTWSSSNTAIATVGSATGIVSGITAGTATIMVAGSGGCISTIALVVNPLPGPVTGALSFCNGYTTTLSCAAGGGTWSCNPVYIAVIGTGTGVVAAVASGTVGVTYTLGTGCITTATITINSLPGSILGGTSLCVGSSMALLDVTTGGTWSSSNPAVGSVDMTTGLIAGLEAGTTTISYTLPTGCMRTTVLLVNSNPVIGGPGGICLGGTTTLTGSPAGGMWTGSSVAIAYPITGTGVVYGISEGIANISYTMPTGCHASTAVTVAATAALSGSLYVCSGGTTTLGSDMPGGTWASSNPLIAGVGSATGIVTGVMSGNANISYVQPGGCVTSVSVTVNSTPGPIVGNASVCVGNSTILSAPMHGGVWSTSAATVATVGTSGVVAGIAAGPVTITYIVSSCTAGMVTKSIMVNPGCTGTPVAGTAVAGAANVCTGAVATFSLAGADGPCGMFYQWQSSPDNVTWTNISGATSSTYSQSPAIAGNYHCTLTCGSSGVSAISSGVHVNVACSLATHTIIPGSDTACSATHFYVTACGISTALSVVTFFGDGTSSTAALTLSGTYNANIYHTYTMPGSYTVKHVLYDAGVSVDSVTYSYDHLFCHTLPVKFYFDQNSNCSFDGSDLLNTQPLTVAIDSNGIAIDTVSVTSGLYRKVYGVVGTVYGFHLVLVPGLLTASCPSSGTIYDTISATAGGYVTKYVGLSCSSGTSYDVSITTSMLCGRHSATGYINVLNSHCYPVAPMVSMTFSPDYSFNYASPAPASVSGTTVTWNLSSLSASSTQYISFSLERYGSFYDWLLPGDTVNSTFTVTPTSGDIDLSNNTAVRIDTVKSSYDPNDMAVSPAGYALQCTPLRYTVRFENTGNDTARNIHILDTLSANLNPATLNIVSASAAMTISLITDGPWHIARFDFPDINLPDSSHHGLCDGMLVYSIRSRGTAVDGSNIVNRAGIFFDDNPPVMTNATTNINGIAPISGTQSMCMESLATLSDATPGGTWSSSGTAVATVGSTGIVTSISAGTASILYTVNNSCVTKIAAAVVTINALPGAITGVAAFCAGTISTLSSTPAGGSWSSGNVAIVTAGSVSGIVTGVDQGSAAISYTLPSGCRTTRSVTVFSSPGNIYGCNNVGIGDTIRLDEGYPSSGMIYNSSNSSVCSSIGSGNLIGISAGTATITKTSPVTGCYTGTFTVTVTPTGFIKPITGATTICQGASVILHSTTTGGTWLSGDPSVATIGSSGDVNALIAGVTTITYNVSGLYSCTQPFQVAPLPDLITGSSVVCVGDTVTLYSDYCGLGTGFCLGGIFSVGDPSLAGIAAPSSNNSGRIIGIASGVTTVTFTGIQSPGCARITTITVNSIPSSAPITGTLSLCSGGTTALTDPVAGGTWSCNSASIATVSSTGIVSGTAPGTATISYTTTNGCGAVSATKIVTVIPLPDAGSITGTSIVCAGATTGLANTVSGGIWSSSAPGIVTVDPAGLLSGIAAGTARVSYAVTNGCSTAYAIRNVTVNPLPVAGTITGGLIVCEAGTTTLSDAISGGAWTSGATGVATIGMSGIVTGISGGTASISYILVNSCGSAFASSTVTVNPLPVAGSISGVLTVCESAVTTLADVVSGGAWSSSAGIATVSAGGVVSGITEGVAGISYTVSNGCGTEHAVVAVTVNPLPAAGTITGIAIVCVGTATTLADAVSGGSWTSAATGIAIAGSTGIVSGIVPGTAAISYTNVNGCGTATASVVVTVRPLPDAGTIAAPLTLCVGALTTLAATVAGGVWSSDSPGIAAIESTGIVTGVASGVTNLSYTVVNDCGTDAASVAITVDSNYMPLVTIDAYPGTTIIAGTRDTLVAMATGGGPSPLFQWVLNGLPVAGATTSVFISDGFVNGDSVSCIITGSGPCGLPGFNSVVMTVNDLGFSSPGSGNTIAVYPNPNKGSFQINGLLGSGIDDAGEIVVSDMLGQVIYRKTVNVKSGRINEVIQLTNMPANGVYMLHLHVSGASSIFHFVVER